MSYKIYVLHELNKSDEYTNHEYFNTEKERETRITERKGQCGYFMTEEYTIPKDTWKLNNTVRYTRKETEEIVKENNKLRKFFKELKSFIPSIEI